MAVVSEFFRSSDAKGLHRTAVECGWQPVVTQGRTLLQLSTYGSDERRSEKKVSQTIQLDEARARELVEILETVFPGIRRQ